MTALQPTRRWFQFGLRTLLVFVTLCAIPCSWLAVRLREVKREEAAAAEIEKAGGDVEWDDNASGSTLLCNILGDDFFRHVKTVRLTDAKVTDKTLELLDAMNQLQELYGCPENLNDDSLEYLKALRELKELDLKNTRVTDAGVEKVAALSKLEVLYLSGTKVTDEGIRRLEGLKQLKWLYLTNTYVSDAGLENLQRLKQLKLLNLSNTDITVAGVKKLQQALPNCKIDFYH